MKSELTLGFKVSITVLYYSFDYSDSTYIMLDDMYVTMAISTRLYPILDLWTANKLQLQLQYNSAKASPSLHLRMETDPIYKTCCRVQNNDYRHSTET